MVHNIIQKTPKDHKEEKYEVIMNQIRKYIQPLIILIVFESVAVTLWLTKKNLFYHEKWSIAARYPFLQPMRTV